MSTDTANALEQSGRQLHDGIGLQSPSVDNALSPNAQHEGWRRLHPATLVCACVHDLKAWLLPAFLVVFFARGHAYFDLVLAAVFLPGIFYRVVRYFTFHYRLTTQEMLVVEGILFRTERHIPLYRIENIDVVQSPLQRIFGIGSASLQTASGGEAEAKLESVSLAVVQEMRTLIRRAHARTRVTADSCGTPEQVVPANYAQSGELVLGLTPAELLRLGLISQRGVLLLATALAAAWKMDLLDPDHVTWLWEHARHLHLPTGVIGLGLALLAIPAFIFLSVGWTLLRFYGFSLRRVGDELRRECGLLTKTSATVSRRRIQLISLRESPLHRLFCRVGMSIETAGGAGGDDHEEEDKESPNLKWYIPLLPKSDLHRVLAQLRPDFAWHGWSWQKTSQRTTKRLVGRAVAFSVVAGILALGALWPWGPWGGLVFPVVLCLAVGHALAAPRVMSYALGNGGIAYTSGVLIRRTSFTFFDKIQSVSATESPFDRRHGMATLSVDTAGAGPAGHGVQIRFLDRQVAETLRSCVASKIERTDFNS